MTFARLSKEKKLQMWREMCLARFEELKIRYDIKESGDSKIPTVALLSLGEEAVSVGAAFACDLERDWLVHGHRSKGALIHFGVTPFEDLANHMCKADSPMRGRDGNVHTAFPARHVVKFISHMIANWPTGCGIAEGLKYLYEYHDFLGTKDPRPDEIGVVLCFCGDGASRQGTFHEAVNFAAARNLPVGFIIDNNRIATDTPIEDQTAVMRISDAATAYNIAGEYIANGNDVITVYNHAVRLIARARKLACRTQFLEECNLPRAPFILECETFRMAEHNETRKAQCVDVYDFAEWGALDPLRFFREALLSMRSVDALRMISDKEAGGMFSCDTMEISAEELDTIADKACADVDEAYEKAKALTDPVPDISLRTLFPTGARFFQERRVEPFDAAYVLRTKLSAAERRGMKAYGVALRDTLVAEMKINPRIRMFGEDVGGRRINGEPRGGGVFNMTHGAVVDPALGEARCFNTPLSEVAIVGAAIGQALVGLIPVAEIQYLPFASVAMGQLIDYLPTWFWTVGTPIHAIFRLPCGGGNAGGEFHSSMRLEATFFHTPGLKMVHPSTPRDVAGLLRAALRDDAPILFFEDIWALSGVVGRIDEEVIPIGPAALRQEGRDLTIIGWGARIWFDVILPAADELSSKGASIELIDLRTIAPLDMECIVQSLKKTHRLLIVHDDIAWGGIGNGLAGILQGDDEVFQELAAPIKVIGAEYCMMPQHPNLEQWYLPSSEKVLAAARHLLTAWQ